MEKKMIIGVFSAALLVAAVFFGRPVFTGKKSIGIPLRNPAAENMQPAENVDTASGQTPQDVAPEQPAEPAVPKTEEPKKNDTDTGDGAEKDPPEKSEEPQSVGKIVDKFISWGFQKADGRKIDTIIVHTSYDSLGNDPYSVGGIIAIYKQYGVGAHYLIGRDGTAYRLVADKDVAYHAGVSQMPDGRKNVNDFSIGIEVVNTKDGKFTSAQYSALNSLIASFKKRYPIKYILGHDDIAPGRKTDPWGIEWGKVNK